MNRSKTRIFIGGMTCVNCQNKIETALLHTAGIEIARVSYQNGTADLVIQTGLHWRRSSR